MRPLNIKSKKGQVQILAPAILALVFASVVLVFGLIMTQSLRDVPTIKAGESSSATNETLSSVSNITAVDVSNAGLPAFSMSVTSIVNATDNVLIDAGNYTTFTNGSVIATTLGAQGTFNGTDWNITYSYTFGGEAYVSANKTIAGLGTFGDFWEIIVLAVVIAVVIGLLLIIFGRQGRR